MRLHLTRPVRRATFAAAMVVALGVGPATKPSSTPVDGPREAEVVVTGDGGCRLAGTLALPSADVRAPYPAVVLLAGSGPTDRNGNQPPAIMDDLLRTLAAHLARQGVASLRYDKRGMYANRVEQPKGLAALTAFYAWEPFVGDARGALEFLRGRPEVDPARVGVIGHSEGGLLALCVATGPGRPPAALVLLSTPGRPCDQLLEDQLSALLVLQHATPPQTKQILDANRAICGSLRDKGQLPPGGVPPGLAALYPEYLTQFYHGMLAVDPARLAMRLAGPVLVVNGTSDRQVSVDRDAKALEAALGRRPQGAHQLILVPGCSHFLKPITGPGADGVRGDVPPATMDGIVGWTAGHL